MTTRLWHPWDVNDNTEKDIEKIYNRKAISEEMQMAVLNVYQYLSQIEKFP